MTTEEAEVELRSHRPDEDFRAFLRALDVAGAFITRSDLLYALEKPWKYAREYEVWVRVGRPCDDSDPDDLPGWRRFLAAVDQ